MRLPRQNISSVSVGAPVKGWNTRDSLDGMDPEYALKLVNMYPAQGYIRTRRGSIIHCDLNVAEDVETLAELPQTSGTSRLIAACDGTIYDVTTSSPITLETGLLSSRFNTAIINNRLVMCNGVDTPRIFDGSTLAIGTYTGTNLQPKTLIQVCQYRSRLYFVEAGTATVWYGETAAITGELNKIDFSFLLQKGGRIAFVAPWSADTGAGLSDYFVIVSEEGEVLVYEGSDPASVATWELRHRFLLPPPVGGRRGWQNIASDLIIVHKGGVTALGSLLRGGDTKTYATITDVINRSFLEAVESWGNALNWDIQYHPVGQAIYVNIPVYGAAEQFVLNPITGAWARYVGMNATTWSPFEDFVLYGSTLGRIYRADVGDADDSAPIRSEVKFAYNYFGDRGHVKRFTAARPIVRSPAGITFSMAIDCNFNTTEFSSVAIAQNNSAKWGEAIWNEALWDSPKLTSEAWYSLTNYGRSGALSVAVQTQAGGFEMYSANIIFERGDYL